MTYGVKTYDVMTYDIMTYDVITYGVKTYIIITYDVIKQMCWLCVPVLQNKEQISIRTCDI